MIAHRYAAPGRYEAELRLLERGGHIARGALARVPVHVRPAPTAVAGEPVTAAPGAEVAFDGAGSAASDSPIARYHWTFGDGATAEGRGRAPRLRPARALPRGAAGRGRLRPPLRLRRRDAARDRELPPVAEAGEAQSARVGEPVTLGGGASYDVDGSIVAHEWDMGDGTRLDGATVTHAYAAPGAYVATLDVRDDSGVANADATDTVAITVNAPPQPVATGPARPIAVGEIAALDASASADPDGAILVLLLGLRRRRRRRGRRPSSTPGPPPASIPSP